MHHRLGSGLVSDVHVADHEEPVDGSQPTELDAMKTPLIPSPALFLSSVFDDLAAAVIMPRLGEEEVIPERPGFLFWLLAEGPVFSAPQAIVVGEDYLMFGPRSTNSVLAHMSKTTMFASV